MPQMTNNPQDQGPIVDGGPWGTIMLACACVLVLIATIYQWMGMSEYLN